MDKNLHEKIYGKAKFKRTDSIQIYRLVQTDCVKRSGIESFLTPCVFRMRKNRTTLLRKRMRFMQVWTSLIPHFTSWAVWPDLAKLRHFDKMFKIFGNFLSD